MFIVFLLLLFVPMYLALYYLLFGYFVFGFLPFTNVIDHSDETYDAADYYYCCDVQRLNGLRILFPNFKIKISDSFAELASNVFKDVREIVIGVLVARRALWSVDITLIAKKTQDVCVEHWFIEILATM